MLLLLLVLQDVDFGYDVRPILSDNCFTCHGADEKRRGGDLRLDQKEGAFAEHDGRRAVVPGSLAKSEMWRRLTTSDPKDRMPPAKTGKSLSPKQLDILRRWIESGAKWGEHWGFVPPVSPKIAGRDGLDPLDLFVRERLDKEGLAPSPEADRVTLLRRLSLDLTGLPPTPADVDAFVADGDYGKQVERLLASPHYGERWARHWLDAARYADSDGYEKDKAREVWFYRDWVINAFNRDLPYDRFVIEQVAGDQIPDGGQDAIVATGFLRNSMINEEGGVDPEQFRMEAMFDRMDALGRAVLGLTIQCAQCHTHKYDPIQHEDYYRLFAFLNDAHEAAVTVYTPEQQMKRAELLRKIRDVEAGLRERTPDWREKRLAWEAAMKATPSWTALQPEVDDISTGGQKYVPMGDDSFLAAGYAPTKHKVKLTAFVEDVVRAFRLELLNDPNLPHGGPGRSLEGTGALTEFEVEADGVKVKFASATSDLDLPEAPLKDYYSDKSNKKRVTGPVAFAIDGKDETAWGIDAGPGRRNAPRVAVFVLEKPLEPGARLVVYLKQNHGGWNSDDNQNCNLGRMRVSTTSAENAVADPLPPAVRAALDAPERSPAQDAALFSAWRVTVPEWKDANAEIEALWATHPEGTSQLALRSRDTARMTRLLDRGDFLKPMRAVEPGVPGFLHPLPKDAPRTRLSFAKWLVARESPTTARAFVNRVWQAYFGTGLVATSEDFGSQGLVPSHPALLDWLSVRFMDGGWKVKDLHRIIVMSKTYRQSSVAAADQLSKDPANRWLSRGPRLRVEGEIVRDIALAASGLLNPKVGGPSVFPPAPGFLFQPPVSYGPKVWREEKGEQRYRRALYTFRYRSVPYPALEVFDTPNGDASCVRRSRSNTPLQALTTLNEPLFLECARALGAQGMNIGVEGAFRLCVGRRPTPDEAKTLGDFLRRQTERMTPERAKELAGVEGATPEQGAWTALARVLLNLDETITKE
ncbi:MAG TPA: PSD1 and planctomycete cytochrome C domain-containing protein [Planctomycetota bacterium]